jgi:uncharacterized protein (TIGR02246 family)
MADRAVPSILQDWVDAQNEHDASKHASLYTEDGVLEDVISQLGITAELLVGIGRVLGPHRGARQ